MDTSGAARTLRVEGEGMILEIEADGPAVRLSLSGEDGRYLAAGLGDLLAVSVGRPWSLAFPGVREPAVRRSGAGLTVRCAVGPLAAEATFAFGDGALHTEVVWRNAGARPLRDVAVGLALPLPDATAASVTLPGVLYRGNPSADPDRVVPRLGVGPHGGLVVEEHRLPVPGVHAEWPGATGPRFLTLYALDPGDGSLGALVPVPGEGTALLALSGPVMFNGEPDVAYTHKAATAPHPGGYRDLAPGAAITLRHALRWGRPSRPGHGFRDLVHHGLRRYAPSGARPLSLDAIVELKTAALDRRWHEAAGAAGYLKFHGPGHVPGFMYGWTGQCLRLAWCDARLGLERGEEWRLRRCRRAVDFYLDGSAQGAPPGLRLSFHHVGDGRWTGFERHGRPFVSARAFGDTLGDLADVIVLLRDHGRAVPDRWLRALDEGLDAVRRGLLPDGLVPLGWALDDGAPLPEPPGAAGLPCVLALLKAQRVTPSPALLRDAADLLGRYQRAHADDFATPFSHATLDAACEDKEGGIAFFLCAYELLLLTGESRYREWAAAAADWLLTWVYQWNPAYPPGSPLRERGFAAAGWPVVSVQNHHVDVFFPVHELARFGDLTGRPEYTDLADTMIHAMGQGICARPGEWDFAHPGEQAEGFFPTNWQARGTSNTWNPSWVTAQVLAGALRLRGAPAADG
ncbi:hypothetical protein [Streptomyces johnsoniae]|uniref:Uncharacterized protein n=1 Tax=Streptomyces johnsoniae TaxID=3075532 RepID=A0ABU2S6X8_9ACTN|nr:hypothetical protein [Streptomyces sp. DSM 41886]MDT0444726.1 hypothetical protein [Streptomyces sp. DSM 41886]